MNQTNILSDKFLSKYKGRQPNWGYNGLGFIVYKRTYSRIKDDGTNEDWWETVARCVNGAQKIGAEYTKEEAESLYDKVFNLKCNFAGRMLWQLGTPMVEKLAANSLLNCWFVSINELKAFEFLFENLMLGGGVGYSIRKEDVHELPRVKEGVKITVQQTKDADFIVPDSRAGWVRLLNQVLKSYFITGKSFSYSTILIRGAGERINGFGGTASGPTILVEGMGKISKIIIAREGKKLRSIDVLDICNIIGSIVVAGNVRRSAQIALGDPDDHYFIRAKNWSLGNIPNTRAMSNNTIYADEYSHISNDLWENGFTLNTSTGMAKGEPYGFFNLPLSQKFGRIKDGPLKDSSVSPVTKDNCIGTNPCQPAWAPILTRKGIKQLKDVNIGDKIWSADGWTEVINKWSTGIKPVYRYKTTAGIFYGTENHQIVSEGVKIKVGQAESIDRLIGPYESYCNKIVKLSAQDVIDGIVFGDGSVHKASDNLVHLCIGKDDIDYHNSEIKDFILKYRPGLHDYAWEVKTSITANEIPFTYLRSIPDRFVYGSCVEVAAFLRGLYTANGSICGDRVTLKASSFKVIEQVQLMLSSLGIASYYTTNKPTQVTFDNGDYLCRESYDINITTDKFKFAALIGFIQQYKTEKLTALIQKSKPSSNGKRTYDIIDVSLVSEEEVFDLTVDNSSHTYWTGGLNVSNCGEISLSSYECCNLSELYLNNIESEEELIECASLMYKTQKAICALPFLHEETNNIVHKNMRIGLGITGVCQSLDKIKWLDKCYKEIRKLDKEWSKKRGWNQSIKISTVKPSGTLSLLAGSTPGVHPAYSRYYIRRVRMGSNDQLVNICRDLGYKVEYVIGFDGQEDRSTMVVEFPCESGEKAILTKDMSAIKQLELVKTLQSEWADNAVSVTVYYKPEELQDIKKWMAENYEKNIKSVSFLLHSQHGFRQAPYEEITKEKYEELRISVKSLTSFQNNIVGDMVVDLGECVNGSCPIR